MSDPQPDRSPDSLSPNDSAPTSAERWPAGIATSDSAFPGVDVAETARMMAGELPDFPVLPTLPARGVGADPVGGTVSLLVDVAAEVVPSGWRLAARPGMDVRRARDFAERTADAAQEYFVGAPRLLVSLLGPLTLAARLELRNGSAAVGDHAAVVDLADSLAEGLRARLADLQRRLPGTELVVALDEPDVPTIVDGLVPTPSGFGSLRALSVGTVHQVWDRVVAVIGGDTMFVGGVAVDRWNLLPQNGLRLVRRCSSSDFAAAQAPVATIDAIAAAVDMGTTLLVDLGHCTAVRTTAEEQALARSIAAGWQRLGFPGELIARRVIVSAGPGLSTASSEAAQRALGIARRVGRILLDPPDH